jgi:MinD superfamily P-loop ATPase
MIHRARCTRCGRCIRICPVDPKALSWPERKNAAPVHHMEHCISCFCCQEACPSRAVSIKRPLVGRLLFAFMLVAFPVGRMIIHAGRRVRGVYRSGRGHA